MNKKATPANGCIKFRPLDFPLLTDRLSGKVKVFRRKNGVWYARFTLDRKRLFRSTHLSADKIDRETALRKAYEIMLEVERQEKFGFPKKVVPTLATFAKRYLEFAETNKASSTFIRDKDRLLLLVKTFGKQKLDAITREKFERFMQRRKREGAGPSPVNHDLRLLRHVMTKAVDWKYIRDNPLKGIKLLKEPPPGSTGICLTQEEEERLLSECERSKNPVLTEFVIGALYTFMRPSEIYRLTWDAVNFDTGMITVKQSKNNERRMIPMHDKVFDCLSQLKNKYPYAAYVFCKKDGSPYKSMREAFQNAAERAGLRTDKRHFRLYDCRHTGLSRLGMTGCNVFEIASISGHKTPNVLRRYTHISPEHQREVINRIGAKVVQPKPDETAKLISDVDK
jgi:integrase